MRIVDHVLVEHGVRVAEDESGQSLIVRLEIVVVYILTSGSEEHGIYFRQF